MSLPTASSVSSPGGKGADTSLLYSPVSAYSVERGQLQASTASRTRSESDFVFFGFFGFFAPSCVAFAEASLPLSFLNLDADEAG